MDEANARRRAEERASGDAGARHALGVQPASRASRDGGAVRRYEELEGAEGREVFFRPQRYTAADLAPLRGAVVLLAGGPEQECPLRDVSQNGVAFAWPPGLPVDERKPLSVALRFDGRELFRGEAQWGSVRDQDGTTVVGITFLDFLLDVDEVLQLRNVARWKASVEAALPGARAWAVAGCNRYKALVGELRLLFEDTQLELAGIEQELPWHVLHGKDNAVREALVTQLREGFVAEAVRLSEAIDDAVRELPGGHGDPAAKEWSRRYVEEYLLQSPGCQRARQKPFGYAGDYEVMNFIYGQPFEGTTLFARAVELAFWHSASARAVRGRKDLVKGEIRSLIESRSGSHRPVRILSIASGPAQELFELLHEIGEPDVPVEVVLFDQDKSALAHAWRRLQPTVTCRFPRMVRLTFLHDSIKRLLRDPRLFEAVGRFDLAYSAGLLDYLQQLTAIRLTRNLAQAVHHGGRLLVANMVDHPARWFLEVPLDWPLVYRTREELVEIGRRAVDGADVRILEEGSRMNPFFELVRP